ncbi:MAG: hypothetical protein AMJ65_03260 [Phycisphaerae bacterium SG8_4]|nr:MAG: hypothetical protein AMJ65_03260 [Phycisphaerae bacterium SG8_4]
MHRGRTCFVIVIVCVALLGSNCFGDDIGKFEYWTTAGASFDIEKNWRVSVDELLKLGDDARKFTYHHTDLGFVYQGLADWVDLGFNYRHAFGRYGPSDWRRERRPHVNVTFKSRLGEIDLSDRSRLEYRDKDYAKDQWRYTNKLTLTLPGEFTKWKMRPYFADQVYIDLDGYVLSKNKVYSGFSFELSEDLVARLLYVWDSDRTYGNWRNTNILWLQLRLYF